MRAYELMIIFDSDLDEEAVSGQLAKITGTIEAEGGRVASLVDTEPWGRRRFAYRINHKWEGFYAVLEVVTEARDVASTDRILRLADRSEIVPPQDPSTSRGGGRTPRSPRRGRTGRSRLTNGEKHGI